MPDIWILVWLAVNQLDCVKNPDTALPANTTHLEIVTSTSAVSDLLRNMNRCERKSLRVFNGVEVVVKEERFTVSLDSKPVLKDGK